MAATGLLSLATLAPPVILLAMSLVAWRCAASPRTLWRSFGALVATAWVSALVALVMQIFATPGANALAEIGLRPSLAGAWLGVLVLLLGTVIVAFSSRYLQGEPNQSRYVGALAGVLGSVQVLLLADHWLVLIASWALVGSMLHHLLCFYPGRPFALLAAHKKRLADRIADLLLVIAAALAWREAGSGSLSALRVHLAHGEVSAALQVSACCLVLAVILRTALLPAHGWLIQVMEAPTPVSALLHAGVVNLGGFVLLRFATLLESVPAARWLLILAGLGTSVLAGMVMLTRVSIKVRLAWSTVAQMGFMVLECGLGLYTLAMLHLIGHSLYKAHAFLSSSTAVQQTTLRIMRGHSAPSLPSMVVAPLLACAIVLLGQHAAADAAWPSWWTGVLALAWAPLLWRPFRITRSNWPSLLPGPAIVATLTAAAMLLHRLPLGVIDAPDARAGTVALCAMTLHYVFLVVLNWRAEALSAWRRRAYAGFYLDEFFTQAALRLWPAGWTPASNPASPRIGAAG